LTSIKNHLLLISYVFPPYYGIGGKRWAKHADALTKLGFIVHVVCAKNPFPKQSLWTDLVKNNPNIFVHQLPGRFPKSLVRFDQQFLGKILYRFWINFLPMFTKGSYLDRSIFWKQSMLKKARKLIVEHSIQTVICSGAPFGAMYQTTLLKNWFKDLFIINDLRDPWTWGPNWGYSELQSSRMAFEQMLERKMIEGSDIITVPTLELKVYLDKKYPQASEKIKTLFHFFDKSEIVVEAKTDSKKLRFVFYGTIYHHIPELIEELASELCVFEDKISVDFFTDSSQQVAVFEKYKTRNVFFHPQIPAVELFKKFKDFDYVLLLLPSVGVDHISTKFYEVIFSRTPFLVFSEKGLAPEFVAKNRLGIHVEPGQLGRTFKYLTENKNNFDYNADFNVDAHTLENNATQIASFCQRKPILKTSLQNN